MSFGLQEGTIFAGRYQVLACIAAGGMGAVYEVLHLETERRRALKVMLPQMLQSAEFRDRFKREAKVAARIESEFIVDVFDAGIDEATQMPFLVMELLKGEELGKRLKRQGRLSAVEVVTYLQQVAMALDKTHQASIVHRDLKPDNLFLTLRDDGQPRIKVLDFGVAKVVAESATAAGGTRSLGTPLYMSPEQFNPEARLTGAADIYALGMIAYTLLVGISYWDMESRSGNVVAFAMITVKGPPEPASVRSARYGVPLPPAFDAWFAQMTAGDPAYRYPTATGAIAALAEALGLPSPRASFSLEQGGAMPGMPPSRGSQSGIRSAPVFTPILPTPSGAAMTGGPPARSRGPLLAAVLVVGVGMLGTTAFLLLRSSRAPSGEPASAGSGAEVLPAPAAASASSAGRAIEPAVAPAAPASSAAPLPEATVAGAAPGASAVPGTVASATAAPAAPSVRAASGRPAGPAPKKEPKQIFSQD